MPVSRRPTSIVIPFLALLLASSCQGRDGEQAGRPAPASTPFDLVAARAIIEPKNLQFTRAHVAGDVATIDAMFTRDARSFPPDAEPAVGPAALHALTVEYLKSGVRAFTERTTDLYGDADMLIDEGEYVMTYGPHDTVERGKYLNVWTQEDGTWKLKVNMWNTSPATPASH
jgi:ketosteroid isomerase-like protein